MRKKIAGCMVVLTFGALLAGGCAKKEVVKGEEPITAAQPAAPSAAPEVVTPQKEEAKPAPAPAEAAPITGESKVSEEAPQKGGATAAELQEGLQKIYFNFDSAELSEEARTALSKNADLLGKQSSIKLRIEGNCDERGSDEYNMALGERRAQAAKNYLVNLGVQGERISVISYGEEKPADPGHDEAAWAKNRRDEFVIVK